MMKHNVLILAGTRPEAIKMIPVYRALRDADGSVCGKLVATGQHREMLNQAFHDFYVKPDISLDIMTSGQTLAGLSAKLFSAIDDLLDREKPDGVLVQGDTTTVKVASLCAFYRRIPIGHVEAGLRSHDIKLPFPEELNRRVTGLVASWHFAPTDLARQNLLSEKVREEDILVTGNTVIDSLLWMRDRIRAAKPELSGQIENIISQQKPIILVTGHRRESFGQGFSNICQAILTLAKRFPDVQIIYPVHLNPNVKEHVTKELSGNQNIILEQPLSYKPFIRLMDASHIILTDSGGIQEEGPSLGKPVLIMRDLTERPEGVEAGVNRLVGTDPDRIVAEVSALLADDAHYKTMVSSTNPYGDGSAGERIAAFIQRRFSARNSLQYSK